MSFQCNHESGLSAKAGGPVQVCSECGEEVSTSGPQTENRWIIFEEWDREEDVGCGPVLHRGVAVRVDDVYRVCEHVKDEATVMLKDGTVIHTRLTLHEIMVKIRGSRGLSQTVVD